jgi:hypothetical protein
VVFAIVLTSPFPQLGDNARKMLVFGKAATSSDGTMIPNLTPYPHRATFVSNAEMPLFTLSFNDLG